MLKKLKLSLTAVMAMAVFVAPLAVVGTVGAQAGAPVNTEPAIQENLCQGSTLQFGGGSDCATATEGAQDQVNDLIGQIINIFSIIVAIVAVIMIIVGGFKYITSGGDSGNVSGAKNTILYAIIGLVIVALAQFVVKFVLSKATGLAE